MRRMSELCLYNTRTRRKEPFVSLEPGRVRVYSCGPTVYSHQHLGNMRAYVFADLLKRTLRYFGWEVFDVVNITDVGHLTDDADAGEDKMEVAARRSGASAQEIAAKWTAVFQRDLEKLHVRSPHVWCKASEHIEEQIAMVRELESRGFTYRTSDGIYFDTSKDPHYGELARLSLDEQEVQGRIEGASEKRNPADFALWKLSPADGPRRQMEWDSPWGRGFPGWHLECSAMSTKYLGERFDIHTGGVDHIPVHHTNEIAQSENALGVRPWVQWWMHGAWLMFDREKMSKSKGRTVTLDDLEERGIEPLAFRYFLLGAHYRQQTHFSDEALEGARTAYRRLRRHAAELAHASERGDGDTQEVLRARFREALADDMNTPKALAVVWEVVRSDALGSGRKWELLREFDDVLGLDLESAAHEPAEELDERLLARIHEREQARRDRDFALADRIRDELHAEGILIEDSAEGTRWRRV
jgi:cysteinyl-tRNA synthetase